MKIKEIYVEAKRSHNYQTYTVGMTAEVEGDEAIDTSIEVLQKQCRDQTQKEIDIDTDKVEADKPIEEVPLNPEAPNPAPAATDAPKAQNPDQLGALWIKGEIVEGMVGGTKQTWQTEALFKAAFQETTSLKGKLMYEGMIGTVGVRILPNAYKKADNQPDYVVFKK